MQFSCINNKKKILSQKGTKIILELLNVVFDCLGIFISILCIVVRLVYHYWWFLPIRVLFLFVCFETREYLFPRNMAEASITAFVAMAWQLHLRQHMVILIFSSLKVCKKRYDYRKGRNSKSYGA